MKNTSKHSGFLHKIIALFLLQLVVIEGCKKEDTNICDYCDYLVGVYELKEFWFRDSLFYNEPIVWRTVPDTLYSWTGSVMITEKGQIVITGDEFITMELTSYVINPDGFTHSLGHSLGPYPTSVHHDEYKDTVLSYSCGPACGGAIYFHPGINDTNRPHHAHYLYYETENYSWYKFYRIEK
jgi:hypothetical protein